MKYPQSFIDEIRQRVRVSEVIGRAIPLRRAGREFHALCPFHKEKTPSFTVNDEKGFFHCFGCGAHGDVIGFVKDYEHLTYREAIEKMASLAGLAVPQPTRMEAQKAQREQSLQQVMELAAGWFEHQLEQSPEGELARHYVRERGLAGETLAQFRIGYAPTDRDQLARAMKPLGVSEAQLVEVGLLIQVDGRAPYSRFRRRLMFPIRDRKSRVIAFGGRVLPGEPNDDAPKYLNSPETPLFHKGRQLYNMDRARRPAFDRGQLLIAEGYMDVVALAQAGIAHAVAPLGTAITAEQLQLCWQICDTPTLCLDGDAAGQRAMQRALALALPLLLPGKSLNFAVLPPGEDPDSLIRQGGAAAFEAVQERALPLSQLLWDQAFGIPAATPEARAAQEQGLMQKIGQIQHPSVQHYYRQFAREKLRDMQTPAGRPGRIGQVQPWRAGQRSSIHAAPAGMGVAPPPIRTANAALLEPTSNLLALTIAHPAQLDEGSAETFWMDVPLQAPWQQQLHQLITELHISQPELNSAALWQAIDEEAPPEARQAVEQALARLGIRLAMDDTDRISRAQRLWGEVANSIDRARLKAECEQAATEMAAQMNEANFERYVALKAQLEALELESTRFWQSDPLPSHEPEEPGRVE